MPPRAGLATIGKVMLLWGAGLGAAAQYGKVSVIYDQLPAAYPGAGAMLGWAVSLVGLVGIALGVVAGLFVARVGYRRALLGALWLGAALSLVQSLLPPLPLFLALRGVEGVSHLALVVAAPTLIAQITPDRHRGLALTVWGTFFGVAFALLAWLGLPLVARFGLGAMFLAHGVYMAAFAVALAAWLPKVSVHRPTPVRATGLLSLHIAIYRSPYLAAPALGWLFYTFCFVSILTVLPPLIAPEWRTATMAAFPLVAIASSLTFGVWLLRHRPAVWVVQLGFMLSLGAVVWLWQDPGAPAACLALSAAMGLIQGASFAAVPQLNRDAAAQAQANGAMAQMGNLGNTLGTPVIALGLSMVGPMALPLLAGMAMLAGLGAHMGLARRRIG